MGTTKKKVTLEDAWEIIREVGQLQKETKKEIKELGKKLDQTDELAKQTFEGLKQTDEQVDRTTKAVDRTTKAVDRTTKNLDRANGNFNNKWGAFLENLVRGDLVALLKSRDIAVERILSRMKFQRADGSIGGEYDLVAINGKEVVVVEVKTTLGAEDIDEFLGSLKKFKTHYPEYGDKRVYGGIAYLGSADRSPKTYAINRGLFLIQSPGGKPGVSTIINERGFKPKEY